VSSFGRNDGSLFEWEKEQTTAKATAKAMHCGWLTVYIPPIAECARWMGHPGVFGQGRRTGKGKSAVVGWKTAVEEKRISPLRRSQKT
jgi:hypothetical protein